MAQRYVVISALGADRVGLADDIAAWVESAGGNVEESKMAVLGGDFAVVMLVGGGADAARSLLGQAPARAAELGIRLEARETGPPRAAVNGRPYLVQSVSLDSPGIVHAVTGEIRALGIGIEDLETGTTSAPWTGAPMFHMKARVILPPDLPAAELREQLDRVAHERDLDITLEPLAP